jgi:hypothetical protein
MPVTHATLDDLGCSDLEIEILYEYQQGEPMVMYYPDGSGYPGYPEHALLMSVRVKSWGLDDQRRHRSDHWIWTKLDELAYAHVEKLWDGFGELCIEAYHDSYER